jgi:hypothetical protein
MQFTPNDFKRLMFDFYNADMSVPFSKQFPELELYKEFSEKIPPTIERNKLLKWIAFVYDKGSPYRDAYKNILDRKVVAMIDVGYGLVNGKFDDDIEDIIQSKNHKVADMVIAYIKLHCEAEYTHLIVMEAMYFKQAKNVLIGGEVKVTEMEAANKAYSEAINKVRMNDQDKGLTKSLYRSINKDKFILRPEDIAKSIKEKGFEETVKLLEDDED